MSQHVGCFWRAAAPSASQLGSQQYPLLLDRSACWHSKPSHVLSLHPKRSKAGKKQSLIRCALEEADWEEEMSLFRKRLQKPNQLETLRKIVEEVDIGKAIGQPY